MADKADTTSKKQKTMWDALLAVQAETPKLQKSAINPHFKNKYVPLEDLMETIMPILNKHGFIWITLPAITAEGKPALTYQLQHVATNQGIQSTMLLLSGDNPQQQGSAITYARRYSLMALLGLVADTDDDANTASNAEHRSTGTNSTEPASDAQRKFIFSLLRDKGFIGEAQKAVFTAFTGLDSTKELTKKQASTIINDLKEATADELNSLLASDPSASSDEPF